MVFMQGSFLLTLKYSEVHATTSPSSANGHVTTLSMQRLVPFLVLNTAWETLFLNHTCFDIFSLV